ncbi:recombinase family protein [Escherichia coli]|nr:recombinase family protein [Escherichia coli]
MKLLVTYIRWSTKEQDSGDSLRRQTNLIDAFYAKHKEEYYLLPAHRYVDKGKSGFHQQHKNQGSDFRRMFENVMSGAIPEGSLIVVENFDRFSRADIDTAIDDVRQILRKGVSILTLGDGELYDKSALTDPVKLIKHIIIAERAHQESLVKQKRIAQVWNHKTQLARELKKPMGKQAPGWLELSEDGSHYIVDEDKASLVNIIYDKRLSGMSMFAICKWLNEQGYPTINQRKVRISKTKKPDGNWSALSVKHILTSRSVLGYLPAKISTEDRKTVLREEIESFYPQIVTDSKFYAVQQLLEETGKGKTSSGEHWLYVNILKGLIRCKCGLVMTPTGIRKPVYQGTYRCNGNKESRCSYGTVSRKLLDTQLCSRLFSKLSQLHDEATDTAKLDELQRRLNTVDSELEKLTETLIQLPNITQIQEALRVKQEEKDELIVQLSREKARVKSVSSLDLSGLDMESVEGRTEAQIIIKRLVKEIVVSGNEKLVDIYLHNGNMIRGFPLDGKDDHTLTLEEATDEMQPLDDMLIFGEPVTRIYPAGDMEEVDA